MRRLASFTAPWLATMSEFLAIDHVPEKDLPPHANDGRSGDRVAFLEAGLLHVEDGGGTFVRWGDVLGVVEHLGSAFVLVPRRPPRRPWIRVDAGLVGDEPGAIGRWPVSASAGPGVGIATRFGSGGRASARSS